MEEIVIHVEALDILITLSIPIEEIELFNDRKCKIYI